MRACIVAKTPDKGINYWIKAYGKVTNAGVLDASTLAAGLQNKSDKGHTHRAAEITDFAEAVAALTVYQKIGTFDICKLPDGTQIESGTVRIQNHNNNPAARVLTWPLAFITAPVVVATLSAPEGNVRDIWVTIDSRQSNQSAVYYWCWPHPVCTLPASSSNTASARPVPWPAGWQCRSAHPIPGRWFPAGRYLPPIAGCSVLP